ncbi:hypothetical protein [Paenibacillus antarcticus]|uniref:BclA C-terminal domain-containing protein n=1 Tax=Paenibacillus antarcticus TaxID=253703 RepID=A0A168R150_9BACL|nr:hypothetical protein [Paenibacillus antarcticus]OAB48458.1 hypothetical protein PBAT_02165 [Paenibacillus antarcticus]
MSGETESLVKTKDGTIAPQYYDIATNKYNYAQGRDGAPFVTPVGSHQLKHGLVSVAAAGTAVQLPTLPCREVTIIAKDINTGDIFIGGTGVLSTSYGAKLKADSAITLTVNNANLIFINASVGGEGISYIAT